MRSEIMKDLRGSGLLQELKASNLPSQVSTYLNREDKPSWDRPQDSYVHCVAALTLRDDVSKFAETRNKGVISPGTQLAMLTKL